MPAAEFARLSGVSRERLRTWERRHDFPQPVRNEATSARLFSVTDVPRVIAAARLMEAGYPVGEAIKAAIEQDAVPTDSLERSASVEHAPVPAIALARGADGSISVAWANTATQLQAGSLGNTGEERGTVERLGPDALEQIAALFDATTLPAPVVLAHGDWVGTYPVTRHSLCWRAVAPAGDVIVLLQVPDPASGSLGTHTADDPDDARWAAGIAAARHPLQEEAGLPSAQHAVRELVGQIRAFDGLLVLRHQADLRTASSVRGTVTARAIAAGEGPELQRSIDQTAISWLTDDGTRCLGLPSYLTTLSVPLAIGGRRLGAAVLVFLQQFPLSESIEELLHAFGTALAAAIERERGLQ